MNRSFYPYITTNPNRTTLYVGVTGDLPQRMIEHYLERGNPRSFTGRYYCYFLIYYEEYSDPLAAIQREKEIKKWRREKKEQLINEMNPEWKFLNYELFDHWPPNGELFHRRGL
jgi:putative endonuclease